MLRFLRRLTVATVACGITLFWLWNTRNDQEPVLNQDPEARYSWTNIRDDGHERPPFYEPKISIVSVCNVDILLAIEDALSNHRDTGEVILVCTKDEEGSFRRVIDHMLRISSIAFSIQTVEVQAPIQFSLLKAATYAIYSHVLILDSFVPLKNSSWIADTLLAPAPSGPCRYTVSHPATGAGIESETIDEDVSLLFLPPFVIKRDQVRQNLNGLPKDHHLWVTFYARLFGSNNISSPTPSPVPLNALSSSFCPHVELANISATPFKPGDPMTNPSFMVITHDLSLLHLFRETICRLLLLGNAVNVVFITGKERDVRDFEWMVAPECYFRYLVKPFFAFLDSTGSKNFDVIFVLQDGGTEIHQHLLQFPNTTILRLNSMDATSSLWMATLTKAEWKAWDRPRIDIAVVTNNRPRSLSRLLNSLDSALYWGHDKVHLIINMEQTADLETRRVVRDCRWKHGPLTVRHRVTLGGLIPAIVESWYPANNDAYGLILEDDVELSPLFFAWIKMNILRYRYGTSSLSRELLYGISLYSPKNVELRPLGRQPWSAQVLFEEAGLPSKATPYLSGTPCSWGAVYFPEHWREFHDYLISRQSEEIVPLDTIIVPDVRSNRWKKSWKRFFIEFAWLKGSVMVYPNFDNFVSFSTNHLEIGSHVADASAKARKKSLFVVPLMTLEDGMTYFLQLLDAGLPTWEDLPVVDLHGHLSSLEEIQLKGRDKRLELCAHRSRSRGNVYSTSWCENLSIL